MVKGLAYHSGKDVETICLEYVWLGGGKDEEDPTVSLRSKTRIYEVGDGDSMNNLNIPEWGYDGSSTGQAKGEFSDKALVPVRLFYDPFRNTGDERIPHILVLNEVYNTDGTPHRTNTRAALIETVRKCEGEQFWFGIEQEDTFMRTNGRPYGFPEQGLPGPQGPYYCGVGPDNIFGREIMEDHLQACLKAGVLIAGTNPEVMPGQWEYQIGPRGKKSLVTPDPLLIADHLIMGRYLMGRVAEKYNVVISLEPKPLSDWNGAGAHTNFSTTAMREGTISFEGIIKRLAERHREHIAVYGEGIEQRLIGIHETSSCKEFSAGALDRTKSVRIPAHVVNEGRGYLEDRRPNANMDPYLVLAKIMETVGRT